jgi:hypothetical protein
MTKQPEPRDTITYTPLLDELSEQDLEEASGGCCNGTHFTSAVGKSSAPASTIFLLTWYCPYPVEIA